MSYLFPIVDRILERGRLPSLDGSSMRTRHVALDAPTTAEAFTEPAILSGIDRQEFLGPAWDHSQFSEALEKPARFKVCDAQYVVAKGAGIGEVVELSGVWSNK